MPNSQTGNHQGVNFQRKTPKPLRRDLGVDTLRSRKLEAGSCRDRCLYRFVTVTNVVDPSRQIRRNTGWPGPTFCSSRVIWLTLLTC